MDLSGRERGGFEQDGACSGLHGPRHGQSGSRRYARELQRIFLIGCAGIAGDGGVHECGDAAVTHCCLEFSSGFRHRNVEM